MVVRRLTMSTAYISAKRKRKLIKDIIRQVNLGVISREHIHRRPYTYVRVLFYYELHLATVYGHGFSKVCWPDQWDETRGYEIALAKAARDVARQLNGDSVVKLVEGTEQPYLEFE